MFRSLSAAIPAAALALTAAFAQSVEVLSEFRRPAPNGSIAAPDRAGTVRELLSPAVVRNGHTTFNLVLRAAPSDRVTVYVTANPEHLVKTAIYRQFFNEQGLPERLERIEQPIYERFEAGVGVFLLDVFVPADTPIRRIRYEVQMQAGDRWVIYPMELRVLGATVLKGFPQAGELAPAGSPAANTAWAALAAYICDRRRPAAPAGLTQRALIRRNASQDVALARELEKTRTISEVRNGIAQSLGAKDVPAWCAAGFPEDPELYFRARDFVIRAASPKP
ncbi:MAG: hypothetical protein R2729_05785 [Bryobacteraceae bacterium]